MTKIIKIILSILILSFYLTTLSYSQSNELREFFKNSKSAYKSRNLIKAMHFTSKAIELSKKDLKKTRIIKKFSICYCSYIWWYA